MRTLLVATAMLIGIFPVGAAENVNPVPETREQRFARVIEQVKTAPFVTYGKKLSPFVKGTVKAMPKEQQPALEDVVVVNDLPAFARLFGLSSSEEEDMLKFLGTKDAFAFVGNAPLFINGTNPTIRAFEAAFISGDTKPIRLLRAKLLHERRHADGEARELPCYELEVAQLDDDYGKGLLTGAEGYIKQIKGFTAYLATQEPKILASR